MNPAECAGTFIRVWREEWAGLSRAQLANAVTRLGGGKHEATADMVYAWEQGQPPKRTAELLSLSRVMQRHGLHTSHTDELVATMLAACGARQYPELFADPDPVLGDDAEELARSIYEGTAGSPWQGVVPLVRLTKSLEYTALGSGDENGRSPRQERACQAALGYARAALASRIWHNRLAVVPCVTDLYGRNADYIEAFFGARGLGGALSPLGQRARVAWVRAHGGLSVEAGRELLELSAAATRRGEAREAARSFLRGLHALGEAGVGAYARLRVDARRQLEIATAYDGPGEVHVGYLDLVWAALAGGLLDEAERLVCEFESWCKARWRDDAWWSEARLWLAMERADRSEVQRLAPAAGGSPPGGGTGPLYEALRAALRGQRASYRWYARTVRREPSPS